MNKSNLLFIVFIGAALTAIPWIALERGQTPFRIIERSLGVPPSKSASRINTYKRYLPDSKIFELWAAIQISLSDSEEFMKKLGVELVPSETWIKFQMPDAAASWWSPPDQDIMKTLPNQWMRVDTGASTVVPKLCAVWYSGTLYIYYYGLPAQMHNTASSGWGQRK